MVEPRNTQDAAQEGSRSPNQAATTGTMGVRNGHRARGWLERLCLILFGLFLALLLIEGGLQFASLFVDERSVEAEATAQHTILALGDSHTYGVGLPEEEAYPAQLEAELGRRSPGRYQVINLGLPGMNSSQVRALLPAWLARYQPQTIVVCVGINNYWNTSETEERKRKPAWVSWIYSLRTYRLVSLLALRFSETASKADNNPKRPDIERVIKGDVREQVDRQTGEVLVQHEGTPSTRFDNARVLERWQRDIEQIHALTEANGVRLILLAYADPSRRNLLTISDAVNAFGREHGVAAVDPRERFERLLAEADTRTAYFLHEAGGHPNARGYTEIAILVADSIEPANVDGPS